MNKWKPMSKKKPTKSSKKKKSPERKPWVKRPDGSIIMHVYHNIKAW